MTLRPIKLQAVILTGSRDVHNPLLAGTGLRSKVLLPIQGRPMLLSVLETIAQSRLKPDIHISSNDPAVLSIRTEIPFKTLPSEDKAVESILKSLERLPGQGWVLFVSGDHPLLTPEMVDHFVEETIRRELTFGVAAVNRTLVEQHYPDSVRTYFPVKNGAYSGGNMFLINKAAFQGSQAFMETIDRNRKQPWKSAFMLDPLTIAQLLFRRLTIHEVAERASKAFRCNVGILDMPFAECCMDVDKPSDREIAEMILARRAQEHPAPQIDTEINASFA